MNAKRKFCYSLKIHPHSASTCVTLYLQITISKFIYNFSPRM